MRTYIQNYINIFTYVVIGIMKFTNSDKIILMSSSLLLYIPGIYGIYTKKYSHGICSCITSTISCVYWYTPGPSWLLTIDLFTSKLAGVYYGITGIRSCKTIKQKEVILAVPLTILMISGYTYSNVYWNRNLSNWVYFHAGFHFFTTLSMMNTLCSLNKLT